MGKEMKNSKVKQSRYRPGVAQEVKVPRFHDNGHRMVVRLSAVRTGRHYLQEIYLVLISVGAWGSIVVKALRY
jgi:hypothetical protein